jgi:hypothetical protein
LFSLWPVLCRFFFRKLDERFVGIVERGIWPLHEWQVHSICVASSRCDGVGGIFTFRLFLMNCNHFSFIIFSRVYV